MIGCVVKVFVEEGESVIEGDILMCLDMIVFEFEVVCNKVVFCVIEIDIKYSEIWLKNIEC